MIYTTTRREFITGSLAALATTQLSFGHSDGDFLGNIDFVEEGGSPIGTLIEGSHQGRLVFDLAKLTREKLVVSNEEFFIRTRYPDGLNPENPWMLHGRGHVRAEQSFQLNEFLNDVDTMGIQVLECSGNSKRRKFGLLSSASWNGIPITKVIEKFHPTHRATRLLVSGHDEHSDFRTARGRGASWIFKLEDLYRYGAYLVTEMNDAPLPKDHGEPVRLLVPNWYGCSCIKWVNELTFVDDNAPATSQMREFASRTHQDGVPEMARDFIPATMDQSGMVVRVEKWLLGSTLTYQVWGVLWGGEQTTERMGIRFNENEPYEPLENYEHLDNRAWTLWSHAWRPQVPGRYTIQLAVNDSNIRTRRLDRSYYARKIDIVDV